MVKTGEVDLRHHGEQSEDDNRPALDHDETLRIIDEQTVTGIGFGRNDQFPSFTVMQRDIAVLIFPDFQLLDAAGPITVFEAAGRQTAPSAYRQRVIARTAGPVTSSSGVQLVAEAFSDDPFDTLIVAGGWGSREAAWADTRAHIPPPPNPGRPGARGGPG